MSSSITNPKLNHTKNFGKKKVVEKKRLSRKKENAATPPPLREKTEEEEENDKNVGCKSLFGEEKAAF